MFNVIHLLRSIDENLKRMANIMTTGKDELDAALKALVDSITSLTTEMKAGLDRLQAKIDAGSAAVDLSAEVATVSDLAAKVQTLVSAAQAEAPDAPPPAA